MPTMNFTYYGDLLGVSATYRLSPKAAYHKLNTFYNVGFDKLGRYVEDPESSAKVYMFSDSILFSGPDIGEAMPIIADLYRTLLDQDIMLRGAVVDGALSFDPRITNRNFSKNLPECDTLPRAVEASRRLKGARFLIDRKIAHHLLPNIDWHTFEGYQRAASQISFRSNDFRRFICPTPEQTDYELLYYFTESGHDALIKKLRDSKEMNSKENSIHYIETIDMIKRSRLRQSLFP